MRSLLCLPAAVCLWALTAALSIPSRAPTAPLPLLVWHGLGDRYDADGLQRVGALAQQVHPGTYVHFVRLSEDGSEDRSSTFLGNVTEQMHAVCAALHADPQLRDPHTQTIRADALGFSQGGQFLRGLVQRCDGLHLRSLVTFGSQHNGIAAIKACGTWDLVCHGAMALIGNNIWTDYVQSHVVPAQYFRTLNDTTGEPSAEYLASSNFLADINNERREKNETYSRRLAALDKLVMFVFENDTTVIPKESGWFAEVNATSGEVTPLRERPIYREDWLGLRALDKKGGLVFKSTPGDHMQIDGTTLKHTFEEFFGPEKSRWSSSEYRYMPSCGFNDANTWGSPWDWKFWAKTRDWLARPRGQWEVQAPLQEPM